MVENQREESKPSFGGLGGSDGLAVRLPEILTYILFRCTLGRVLGVKGDRRRKETEKQPHRRTRNGKLQVLPGLSN